MTTELVVYDKNGHRITVQRTGKPVYRLLVVDPNGKRFYKYLPSVKEAARRAAWKIVEATWPVYDRDAVVNVGGEDGTLECECGTAYDTSEMGSYHCPLHSTAGGFYREERDRLAAVLLPMLKGMLELSKCAACGTALDDPETRAYVGTEGGALICFQCVRSLAHWLEVYERGKNVES